MDGYLFFNKLISDDTWKLKAVGARRRGGGNGGLLVSQLFDY